MNSLKCKLYGLLLCILVLFSGCSTPQTTAVLDEAYPISEENDSDAPYIEVNNNIPYFTENDLTTQSFEYYSDLDALGRCQMAYACIGEDLMPTEERGAIGSVKPSGWHTVKYSCIPDRYLYNRCHLIGYQLSGENANEKNLITGTRYLNVEGMLPFENAVASYVHETKNHVLYRVTPVFEDENLIASGVLIEALSVEDNGDGICFNVYCYNIQPGITIDYLTGDSYEAGNAEENTQTVSEAYTYILNTNSHKFHTPSCSSIKDMKKQNLKQFYGSRDEAIAQGYDPCGRCHP